MKHIKNRTAASATINRLRAVGHGTQRQAVLVSLAVLILFPVLVIYGKESTAEKISMHAFIRQALANNPALAQIRAEKQASTYTAERAKAVRDLIFSAGAGYDGSSPVYSGGTQTADASKNWTVSASLARSFPSLLGIDAALSWQHSGYRSDSGGSSTSWQSPSLALSLTLPLLRNAFGIVGRANLENMRLAIRIAEYSEQEALESLLISLHTSYINWALSVEKEALYDGIVNRAAALLNQTVRKSRYGAADAEDLATVRQSYYTYKARLNTTRLEAAKKRLTLLSHISNRNLQAAADTELEPEYSWKLPEYSLTNIVMKDIRSWKLARLSREQVYQQYRADRSAALPQLDIILEGGKSTSRDSFGDAYASLDQNNLYAGVELNVPLGNYDAGKKRDASAAAYRQSQAAFQETVRTLEASLLQIRRELATGLANLKIYAQASSAAWARVQAVMGKYRQGRASIRQVTDARNSYASERLSYLEQHAAISKLIREYEALGDLLLKRYEAFFRGDRPGKK